MYKCNKCNEKFDKPNIKNIDAGGINDIGIVRRFEIPTINTCPSCFSTNIARLKL